MEAWPDEIFKINVKTVGEDLHLVLIVDDQVNSGNNGNIYAEVFL